MEQELYSVTFDPVQYSIGGMISVRALYAFQL